MTYNVAETVGGMVNLTKLDLQRVLWGSTRVLAVNQEEMLAYVQVKNWQAKTWAISTNISRIGELGTSSSAIFGVATVEWGNDGGRQLAEVDVNQGTVFAVNGSSLSVKIRNIGNETAEFSCSITPTPVGLAIPPTRTFNLVNPPVGNFGTQTVVIPQFARRLQVVREPESAAYRLLQRESIIVFPGERTIAAGAHLDSPWPISRNSVTLQVNEVVAATLDNLSLIFELGL